MDKDTGSCFSSVGDEVKDIKEGEGRWSWFDVGSPCTSTAEVPFCPLSCESYPWEPKIPNHAVSGGRKLRRRRGTADNVERRFGGRRVERLGEGNDDGGCYERPNCEAPEEADPLG